MAKIKLSDNVQYLKGVGEKTSKVFSRLGIFTIYDLVCYFPYKYIDFSSPVCLCSAPFAENCVVKAEVYGKIDMRVKGGLKICKVAAGDDTASLAITFFSQYAAANLEVGKSYYFYGKITGGFAEKQMASPEFIPADTEKPLIPIYHLTQGISNKYITKCIKTALNNLSEQVADALPQQIIDKYNLPNFHTAIINIHTPKTLTQAEQAKQRLVFDELLVLQLGLMQLKSQSKTQTAICLSKQNLDAFYATLAFVPTNAQKKAITQLCTDFVGETPMNRLLQGDVGSGKTVVAAAGMVVCVQSGYQAVLMAPTEILANQHATTLQKILQPIGMQIVLLTGSIKGKARKIVLQQIETGAAQIVVGTHAILSENVKFANLGFAVTDEQHRFGVRQRALLQNKAKSLPHILVMSATPIPRTLGLLMFGDLDISVLDELPKGRHAIKTYLVDSTKRQRFFNFITKHKEQGRQSFVVCPLVEDGENSGDMLSVTSYFSNIAAVGLPNCKIAMLHGKMKPTQKTEIMQAFLNKEYDVLCSTTVIEVGIDVPNASVMVIENAERYGLSALHQLRGRVGRGNVESFCVLVSDSKNPDSTNRLKYLCSTQDGFSIAQYDMENRGVGDFFGNRQHGLPTLKLASLLTDSKVLYTTQSVAKQLLLEDGNLESYPILKQRVLALFSQDTAFN